MGFCLQMSCPGDPPFPPRRPRVGTPSSLYPRGRVYLLSPREEEAGKSRGHIRQYTRTCRTRARSGSNRYKLLICAPLDTPPTVFCYYKYNVLHTIKDDNRELTRKRPRSVSTEYACGEFICMCVHREMLINFKIYVFRL